MAVTKDRRLPAEIQADLSAKRATSYAGLFRDRVAKTPQALAYTYPLKNEAEDWAEITWAQTKQLADEAAAGFISLGLKPEERVAIASSTRIEWILADLGITCSAGATTTVYPNTHADEVHHILADSGAVIAVLENRAQLEKIAQIRELDDQIHTIILFDDDRIAEDLHSERVITWDAFMKRGATYLAEHPTVVDEAVALLNQDMLSTLIYTSGTTGTPKGVELLHGNWTYEGEGLNHMGIASEEDLVYLWLPLSHVFGRDLLALHTRIGVSAAVDGRVDKIMAGMAKTHPTIMVGVPRIFEKIRAAVITASPRNGIKGRVARWAFAVGRDSRYYRLSGQPMPAVLRTKYKLAEKLVFSKLKAMMGGKIKFLISGSAKLSGQIQEWFYSAGIPIIEGYGMTETAAVAFLNDPAYLALGTVGPALPGIEVKIADDGEILVRGPIVARGYHGLPDETREAFVDGWFHTGDIGQLDEEGNLTITDRKKDLMKSSNGKYIAPQKVENTLMANIPYISAAVAVGEGRKYMTALLTMDPDSLHKWAAKRGKESLSYAELTQLPEIRASIDKHVRRANKRLERWEQIKRYAILDRELSMEADELTPSAKVRRNVVLQHFSDEIEALYASDEHSDLTEG